MARLVCKPNRSDNCQLIIPVDEVLVALAVDSDVCRIHSDQKTTQPDSEFWDHENSPSYMRGGQGATERNF